MSDRSLDNITVLDDETQVMAEIGKLVSQQRKELHGRKVAFTPLAKGRAFPLVLNLGAVAAILLTGWVLWAWFSAAQTSYVLAAATSEVNGKDIISAILAETQNTLAAKNKEISDIQSELDSIAAKLAALGLGDVAQRKILTDRKTVLQQNLKKAIQERDVLMSEVTTQTKNLAQATSEKVSTANNVLQDLLNQQELTKIYQIKSESLWRGISEAASLNRWDEAQDKAKAALASAADIAATGPESYRGQAKAEEEVLASVVKVTTDIVTLKSGQQPQTAADKPLVDVNRPAAPETVDKDALVQFGSVVRNLNETLGLPKGALSDATALPLQIRQLQQIASRVQVLQTDRDQLATKLETFQRTGLQQNLSKQQVLQIERDQLASELAAFQRAGKDYQTRAVQAEKVSAVSDRGELRQSLLSLVNLMKENPATAALFPDYSTRLSSMIENLVNAEVAHARALAQDEFLAALPSDSAKGTVRLPSPSSGAKEDGVALLTTLIKELDQVSAETKRLGQVPPTALGSVFVVSKPNVIARKAGLFENSQVKRVFLSRIAANGERIRIAEAEILASSGDDLILLVTSTVSPNIYPERNDLVFVQM